MTQRIFTALLVLLLFASGMRMNAQGGRFTLRGKIDGQKTGLLTLDYPGKGGIWVKDTAFLKKGRFQFKGAIDEPCIAHLRGDVQSQTDDDPNAAGFYIEPAEMEIRLEKDHFKQMKLTGSQSQRDYEQIQEKIDHIKEEGDAFFDQYMAIAYDFINTHPSSYVSVFELMTLLQQFPIDTVNALYHRLSPAVQQSQYGKQLYPRMIQLMGSMPGRPAADFTATGVDGRPVALSTFKGRYVLLDFWASWCLPCREGAPHLRSLYARYHPLGFDIIGISDDDFKQDAWRKAMEKDSTGIWYNVLRGLKKGPGDADDISASINDQYGIQVLPTKILIGKDGIIIGRYSGTDEEPALDRKLAEIFGR